MDIFISSGNERSMTHRWSAAFPEGRIIGSAVDLPPAGEVSTIWVSAEGPRWLDHLRNLSSRIPVNPVIVASLNPEQEEALAALEAGARGYCHALAAPAMLQDVAGVVIRGGLWVGTDLMLRVLAAVRGGLPESVQVRDGGSLLAGLSPREQQIARALAEGLSNKEVANRLNIAERTVKAHLSSIFEKIGVRDRLQLVLRLAGTGKLRSET